MPGNVSLREAAGDVGDGRGTDEQLRYSPRE